MTLPLADITVIEVDSWMAAPSAAAILADLGARVIKVEPLGGDPMRGNSRPVKGVDGPHADYDFQFDVDNRGKSSIAVALDRPEGAELVRSLIKDAHIFMCNLLPQRQRRFGLDADALLAVNPKLVHATLTGYGTEGPDAGRPGFDVTAFFGRSGLYDSMREGPTGQVPMARPAQGDHSTGLAMLGAILAALRLAERTGKGQVVETSLYETAVWTQATDFAVTAVDRAPVRQRARHELLGITANRFPCGDNKWFVINMPGGGAWAKFATAIGLEALIDDSRYADARSRYRNMESLIELVDAALTKRSRDEWGLMFDAAGLIWGPVLGLHEVANDSQADAIGLFPTIRDQELGDYRSVRAPMRLRDTPVVPTRRAPKLGEDTRAVLAAAGVAAERIDALIAAGVIEALG